MIRKDEVWATKALRIAVPFVLGVALWLLLFWVGAALAQPAVVHGGALKKRQFQTYSAMNLYVNADGGSDSNACTAAGSPCATIQAAVDRIPYWVRHPVTVNIEAGTYGTTDGGTDVLTVTGHRIGLSEDQGTVAPTDYPRILIQGSNTWTVADTGNYSSVSAIGTAVDAVLTDGSKAWTPATLRSQMVRDENSGLRGVITTNTGTQLFVNRNLSSVAPNAYTIERPSTGYSGRIVVENITGAPDSQLGAVMFHRMTLTDGLTASTREPLVSVRNVARVSDHYAILNSTSPLFDAYRPRAAVVFNESRLLAVQAGPAAMKCENASCGFRAAVAFTTSTNHVWSLQAVDSDVDLGNVFIENTYATSGKAVYAERSNIFSARYTRIDSARIESFADIEGLHPVLTSLGTQGSGLEGHDIKTPYTSSINIALRGGAVAGATNSICMRLYNSAVSFLTLVCDDLWLLGVYKPNVSTALYARSYLSASSIVADVSDYTLVVTHGSRMQVTGASPSTAPTADMVLDGTTYTFATLDALSPIYVEGQKGSQYVKEP